MRTPTFSETFNPAKAKIRVDNVDVPTATTVWGTVMGEIRKDLPVADAIKAVEEDTIAQHPGKASSSIALESPELPSGKGCFFLEGVVGGIITFTAVIATLTMEFAAIICFGIGASIYAFGKEMNIVVKAILMVIVQTLLVVDAVILTLSLLITEVLGCLSGLLTAIFRCSCSSIWHEYTRKVCHLTRWAFRNWIHGDWELQRMFPILEFHDEKLSVSSCSATTSTFAACEGHDTPIQVAVVHDIENCDYQDDSMDEIYTAAKGKRVLASAPSKEACYTQEQNIT